MYLEQEIAEQPDVLRRLLSEETATAQQIAQAIRAFDPVFVHIAARGTSDNAARYGQYLFGTHARLPVALATPSLHTLYDTPPRLERALVLGISQSGQGEDVRQVLADARAQGALTVAITNDPALAGCAGRRVSSRAEGRARDQRRGHENVHRAAHRHGDAGRRDHRGLTSWRSALEQLPAYADDTLGRHIGLPLSRHRLG